MLRFAWITFLPHVFDFSARGQCPRKKKMHPHVRNNRYFSLREENSSCLFLTRTRSKSVSPKSYFRKEVSWTKPCSLSRCRSPVVLLVSLEGEKQNDTGNFESTPSPGTGLTLPPRNRSAGDFPTSSIVSLRARI